MWDTFAPQPITSPVYNPTQPHLSSHSVLLPPRYAHSLTSAHAILSFFSCLPFIPASLWGSMAHQLQQQSAASWSYYHGQSLCMQQAKQLTDMTQGVLPQPARNLREPDNQAPPGLSVTGFTWLVIRRTSYQAARCLPDTFPFKWTCWKCLWTGVRAELWLRRAEGFWFTSVPENLGVKCELLRGENWIIFPECKMT